VIKSPNVCTDPGCLVVVDRKGQRCETHMPKEGAGQKDDAGKPMLDLLPWEAILKVVKALEYGAKKYERHGWRKVVAAPGGKTRYLASAIRHLAALARGEVIDPESGLEHAALAACSILFLLEDP
jgi:hypothetical protein